MALELAGIALQRVHRIQTLEQRAAVYHHVLGMAGDVSQQFGRHSVCLQIEGICYGAEAQTMLDQLRGIYLKQEPVEFIADIVGQGYVAKVTLDQFQVTQQAYEPDQYSYRLQIVEYAAPSKSKVAAAQVNASIKTQAVQLTTLASLPDALAFGSLPEITNPVEPLKTALDPVREAASSLSDSLGALRSLLG
ncbi:MAG: hypothetical protein LCH85_00850 [Chloroflexi bacterium]|nr:hypothetical protein [Chloroflexota bacterium]